MTDNQQKAIQEAKRLHDEGCNVYQEAVNQALILLHENGYSEEESIDIVNKIVEEYNEANSGCGCGCEGDSDGGCDCGCDCE